MDMARTVVEFWMAWEKPCPLRVLLAGSDAAVIFGMATHGALIGGQFNQIASITLPADPHILRDFTSMWLSHVHDGSRNA